MKTVPLVIALLGLLGFAGWWAATTVAATGFDLSIHGWIALGLGAFFSLAVGVGLMGLVFYSSRRGYDDLHRDDR